MIGNLQATTRYYLVPGTVPENTLSKTGSGAAWVPGNVFSIPWNQPVIAFTFTLSCTQVLAGSTAFSFNIHRGVAGATPAETPVLTVTLVAGQKTNSVTTKSVVFSTTDTMACTLVTTGDPASGSFVGIVGTY